MNSSINLTEILIVNCAGIFCMLFLFYSKYSNKSVRRVGDILYDCLIALTIIMLSLETVSFYWDGAPGKAVYVMQSIVNALLIVSTTITGYLWCLFVEFKIHHSLKLVRKRACFLVIPILINFVFVILDCFGTGIMFSISEQNVYQRGRISVLSYIFLAFYYIYSICIVYRAKHRGTQMRFFPVYTFVLPCVFGTCVQGLQYGISTGWFAVAMALMFVEFQLQKEEAFVDDLSGLYNRKYLDFYFSQMLLKKNSGIYGIMMDINLFKKINDVYGHTTGDDAIRTVGKLLSKWVDNNDRLIRFAGDEFIIICLNKTEENVVEMIDRIKKNISDYNDSNKKPYQLSFSIGYAKCPDENADLDNFLREMDSRMYEDKERFRQSIGMANIR